MPLDKNAHTLYTIDMEKHTVAKKEIELLRVIRNWFMQKGYSPSIRDLQKTLEYKSPRSITVLMERLKRKGLIERNDAGDLKVNEQSSWGDQTGSKTIDIPLLGVVACGAPMLAEENILDRIPIDVNIARAPYKYFLLRAKGTSMNKKDIEEGDLLLVRIQSTANNGDIVVALVNDEATVKEYKKVGNIVILKPHSTDPDNKRIILTENLVIQGVVVLVIPKV
jgi:repressor LexA